jgi:hypothetical protein
VADPRRARLRIDAFAPAQNMPGWLQAYNDVQPVSVVVKAMRALSIGGPTATPVVHAVLWLTALVAVFAPARSSPVPQCA